MTFHDLVAHKGFADAAMLHAVRQRPVAAVDAGVLTLFHHMLIANRFWLLSILGEPFVHDVESREPDSLATLITQFRSTHESEMTWIAGVAEARLAEWLEDARIPGGRCRVSDAVLQVCLHSQGHRSQIAKMLRALGGTPPMTDFILWRIDRPAPAWTA